MKWINPEDYTFDTFLMFERFQINLMFMDDSGLLQKDGWRMDMGTALTAHPHVAQYFKKRCPERAATIDRLIADAKPGQSKAAVRETELRLIDSMADWVIYTTPELMATNCDFISGWDEKHLFAMADFRDKIVLDIGAGSGRLTFAAAKRAKLVCASEPVGTLREFMRDKITSEGIANVKVLDGLVTDLPFPDDTFDIVMSGHVVGDDVDRELSEMARVLRPNGIMIDCPGDSEWDLSRDDYFLERGWTEYHYIGSFGKHVYCYYKRETPDKN